MRRSLSGFPSSHSQRKITKPGLAIWSSFCAVRDYGDDVQTFTSQTSIEWTEDWASGDHARAHVGAQRTKDLTEDERQKSDLALAYKVT